MGNKFTKKKDEAPGKPSQKAQAAATRAAVNQPPPPPVPSSQQKSSIVPPRPPAPTTNAVTPPPPPPAPTIGAPLTALRSAEGSDAGVEDYTHYNNKLTVEDFDLLRVLGKGAFGKVMLVRKKGDSSGTLYAMKTLRKAALVKRNQLAHTSTERTILQHINCPFLVHLAFAFQTVDKLYMVLDYMAGGELFFWLKKDRRFSENRVRLYTAEMVLALESLHSADIIYRDLKPENILLDADGHLRLTDFGLAKSGITGPGAEGGTKTFCGTPEYLAPEILENKGHGKAVDWWALGNVIFEMLSGLPPYYDTNVQRMYHKILHEPLRFPKGEKLQMSDPAKDLLRGMLERKVSDRLGSTGPTAIKRAAFFQSISFDRVLQKAYPPEFRPPKAQSDSAPVNFDPEFTSEKPVDSYVETKMSQTMINKSNFEDFTYRGEGRLNG